MKKIFFLIPLLIIPDLFSQGLTPKDWGLKEFHIENEKLGQIDYYVTEKGIDQEKPLLFMVCGTRGLPIMLIVRTGEKSTQLGTIPPDQISYFADKFHVVIMGKAGTPFCDSMTADEINPIRNLEDYVPSKEYVQKSGMEWEVQASSLVLDELCRLLPIAGNNVIALGISEGGRLVSKLAGKNDSITLLVCVISGGLNQFFSSIINRRIDAAAGNITHAEAQAEIDSLFAIYKDIYSDPQNTEKWYYGHPYKRWASFCNDIPLDHLVELDIPILFVNGTADRSTPILQADYVMLEFIRLGKTNLTYYVLPGVEHSLYEIMKEDGKEKAVSHRNEAFQKIIEWIEGNLNSSDK